MAYRNTVVGIETRQDHLRIWTNSSRSLIRAHELSVCLAHHMSWMHCCGMQILAE